MLRSVARIGTTIARARPAAFQARWRSEAAIADDVDDVFALPFAEVPSMPIYPMVGSLMNIMDVYPPEKKKALEDKGINGVTGGFFGRPFDFLPAVWDLPQFDDILKIGYVGMGKGITGRMVISRDPTEYMKVLRAEGRFPSGAIETQWMMKEYHARRNHQTSLDFWGRGEKWQTIRRLIQKDMLLPGAAKSYGDAVGEAARLASAGAPACGGKDTIHSYIDRCSFDMFSAAFMGQLTRTANPQDPAANPKNVEFCQAAVGMLGLMFPLFNRPQEMIINHASGLKNVTTTDMFQEFMDNGDKCYGRAKEMVYEFKDKMDRGELNELEKASYLYTTFQANDAGAQMGLDEVVEMLALMIIAAVDTTSGYTKWVLTSLAINQDSQEKVYQELLALDGAPLSTELVSQRNWLPYFQAVKRETHRMCPAIATSVLKETAEPVIVSGYEIPKGELVIFDGYSPQNDPAIIPDHAEFKPERWFDEAVEARKGTAAEVIDHPLMKGPFSAGARQCPASRVANLEVSFMCAQLVRDYKIRLADPSIKSMSDVDYRQELTTIPILPDVIFEPRDPVSN